MSTINQISDACSPYSQELGVPTIKFAEDNVCGYIAQPANTWSNIAYIAIAIMITLELKQNKNKTVLWGFVPVYIFMGLASGFYHASATFVGQFFDFGSIYLFAAFILFLAIDRLHIFETKKLLWFLSGVTILMFVLLWFAPALRIWLFAGQILVFLWVELRFSKNEKLTVKSIESSEFKVQSAKINLKEEDSPSEFLNEEIGHPEVVSGFIRSSNKFFNLYFALGTFFLAWGFWWLDELYIWKDEATMHFVNGHALWHILTAISLYFVYRFYNHLEIKKAL